MSGHDVVPARRNPLAAVFAKLRVNAKILIAPLFVAAVALGVAGLSLNRMALLDQHVKQVSGTNVESLAWLGDMRAAEAGALDGLVNVAYGQLLRVPQMVTGQRQTEASFGMMTSARGVTEAAVGSSDIASTISGVATAAQVTRQGVAESQQAVGELSRMSAELQTLVARFQLWGLCPARPAGPACTAS